MKNKLWPWDWEPLWLCSSNDDDDDGGGGGGGGGDDDDGGAAAAAADDDDAAAADPGSADKATFGGDAKDTANYGGPAGTGGNFGGDARDTANYGGGAGVGGTSVGGTSVGGATFGGDARDTGGYGDDDGLSPAEATREANRADALGRLADGGGGVDTAEQTREADRAGALGGLDTGGAQGAAQAGQGGDTAATNAGPTTGESTGGFAGIGQDTGAQADRAVTTDPNDPTGNNQSPTLDAGLGTRVGGDVSAALSSAAPGGSPSVDVTNAANTLGAGGISSAQDVLAGDTPVAQALSEANAPAPAGQQPSTFNEQAQPGMFDAPTFSFGQGAPAPAVNLGGPESFGDPTSIWPGPAQGQGPLGEPTNPTAPDPNNPSGIPGNMGQLAPAPDQSGFNLGSLLGISPAAAAEQQERVMPLGGIPGNTMTGQGPTTETIVSPWDSEAATIEPYPYTDQTNPQVGGPPATFGTIGNATGQGLYGELAGIVGPGPDPSLLGQVASVPGQINVGDANPPAPLGQAAGVPAAGQPYSYTSNNPFGPNLADNTVSLDTNQPPPMPGGRSLTGTSPALTGQAPATSPEQAARDFGTPPIVGPGNTVIQQPNAQDKPVNPQVADNIPTPTPRPDTAPQIPGTQGPSPFDTAQFPVGPGGAPSTQQAPPSPDTTRPPGVVDAGPTKTVTEAPTEGPGDTTTPEVTNALNDASGGGGTQLPSANAAITPQQLIQPIPGVAPAADGGGGTPAAPAAPPPFVPPAPPPLEDINFGNINPNAGLFGIPGLPGGATGVPGGIPGPPPPPSAFDALNNAVDTG